MEPLNDRLNKLNREYLDKCIYFKNPLIGTLLQDFEIYKDKYKINKSTVLTTILERESH